jgi:uncharacterized protein YjbI with pentapeptide repeats
MIDHFFDSKEFVKIDFTKSSIIIAEYDTCVFTSCNFQDMHVSHLHFVTCKFINCNFSNTVLKDSAFKDVDFIGCKMVGVKFHEVSPFLLQFSFEKCQLNFASFYKLQISNTKFISCNLEAVDFTDTVAKMIVFNRCDLKDAIFEGTNLEKADFREAVNFQINPLKNKLRNASFSRNTVDGILSQFQIIIE